MIRITVIRDDITKVKVDAIVNAANKTLLGGGGVDGAIHLAGGKEILEECKKIAIQQGDCKTGNAVITTAGNLPAKFVIHTVGPIFNGGLEDKEKKLASCYTNSLKLAVKNDCKSIAFPNISTGVYSFPKDRAAKIAVKSTKDFLAKNETIEEAIFVCFDEENFRFIQKEIDSDL